MKSSARRVTDRPIPFAIDMHFRECDAAAQGRGTGKIFRTIVHVSIRPQRSRDRRRRDVLERAGRLAASLKSYLIAQDLDSQSATEETPPASEANHPAGERWAGQ